MIDDFVLEIIIFAFFPNYFNHVRNNHKMEIKSAIQITFFAYANKELYGNFLFSK